MEKIKQIINTPTKTQMFFVLIAYLLFNTIIGDLAINKPTNSYIQLFVVIFWFVFTFIFIKMAYHSITKTIDENLSEKQ